MTIAEALRRFRKEHNLTQQDVADVLGVRAQTYRVYEVDVKPGAEVIKKIAVAYNVSTDYLMGLAKTPNPKSAETINVEFVQAAVDLLNKAIKRSEE